MAKKKEAEVTKEEVKTEETKAEEVSETVEEAVSPEAEEKAEEKEEEKAEEKTDGKEPEKKSAGVGFRERREHKILDMLSKSGAGMIFQDEEDVLKEGEADEEMLQKCKVAKENGTPLLFAFQYADKDGTLIGSIGGVEFSLKSDDFSVSAPYYNAAIKNYFLNIPISVCIGEVDEANKKVSFLSARKRGMSESNHERVRGMAVKALHGCLERGETPRVWGRVISVNPKGVARVHLFDEVSAIITVGEWRNSYTRFFNEICKEGAIYEFDVIGTTTARQERTETKDKRHTTYELFTLSRRNLEPVPFEVVKEKNVQPGDVLCVKCQEIPDSTFTTKNYFYGTCERLRGVEISVRVNTNKDIGYRVGFLYNCKVRRIDENRGIILASAFEPSKQTADAIIKFL